MAFESGIPAVYHASLVRKLRANLLQGMPQLGDRIVTICRIFPETTLNDLINALGEFGGAYRDQFGDRRWLVLGMLVAERIERPAFEW